MDNAVDASVVKADASRQKHHEEDDDDWGGGSRAIKEYLDALDTQDPPAVTPAFRSQEVESTKTMIERVKDRLRLRGISGARDEFLLTATAQNLRRMAKYLSTGPPGICTAVPT